MDNVQSGMGSDSMWKLWCVGIVSRDKPFGTDKIMVSPLERIPDQVGNPTESTEEFSTRAGTSSGESASQDLKGSGEQEATWAPNGDNHLITSPMVRKGETVLLYKYSDDEEVFWTTLFREPSLRRIERFIFGAGDRNGGTEAIDMDSSYILDYNTLDKSITLRTAVSDGEKFLYTIIIDAKNSKIELFDNIGNKMVIDSQEHNVFMEDVTGGKIETRDGHPRIYGPKGIFLETPAQVHIQSGDTLVDGPTVFSDNVNMRKSLALAAGLNAGYEGGSGAAATFNGNMDVTGSVTINGPLTATSANFPGGHGPH